MSKQGSEQILAVIQSFVDPPGSVSKILYQ